MLHLTAIYFVYMQPGGRRSVQIAAEKRGTIGELFAQKAWVVSPLGSGGLLTVDSSLVAVRYEASSAVYDAARTKEVNNQPGGKREGKEKEGKGHLAHAVGRDA